MNALALLKQDHDEVRSLFDELAASHPRSLRARERLFDSLREELDLHARIEEEIFYPALRGSSSQALRGAVMAALEEHRIVKDLLEELDEMSPSDEEFAAKIAALRENGLRHAEDEEREMFAEAAREIDEVSLQRLGRALHERKEVLKTAQLTYR